MADETNRPGFAKRLGEIAMGGLKDTGSQYFTNVVSLKSDADVIKSQVIQDGKTVFDVFNRMKTGMASPGKKIRDWFYSEGMDFGDFGDGGDDFDAGFKVDGANDARDDSPRTLDADSMEDIAKKQTGEAYKIATKQAEMGMANTAEIVSTLNSRSAEITASLNKINDSILGISKKLDTLTGVVAATQKDSKKLSSIVDYDGSLSLAGIFENARSNFMDDKLGGVDMIKMGMKYLSPKMMASFGFQKLFEQNMSILGDRSIKELSSNLNDAIGHSIQTGLMSLIKNEKFHSIFGVGDIKTKENYQRFVTNSYNTKPAVFDGMTRMSIIHIIPEYLKNIEAAITGGVPKSINDKGQLTTKQENYFQNTVRDNAFKSYSSGVDSKDITRMSNGLRNSGHSSMGEKDVKQILYAIKAGIVYAIESGSVSSHKTATSIIKGGELDTTSPLMIAGINFAKKAMRMARGGSAEYWGEIINIVLLNLKPGPRERFAADCTKTVNGLQQSLRTMAETHTHGHQAGQLTEDIMLGATIDKIQIQQNGGEANKITSGQQAVIRDVNNVKPVTPARSEATSDMTPVQTETMGSLKTLIGDKLDAVRDILNRGIDVFVVGTSSIRTTPFGSTPVPSSFDITAERDISRLFNIDMQAFAYNSDTQPHAESITPVTPTMDGIDTSNLNGLGTATSSMVSNGSLMTSVDTPTLADVLDENGNPTGEKIEVQAASANATPTSARGKLENKVSTGSSIVKSVASDVFKSTGIENSVAWSVLGGLTESARNSAGMAGLKAQGKAAGASLWDLIGGAIDKGESKVNSAKGKIAEKSVDVNDNVMGAVFSSMSSENAKKIGIKAVNKAEEFNNVAREQAQTSGDAKDIGNAEEDRNTLQQISFIVNGGADNGYTEDNVKSVRTLAAMLHNKKMKSQITRYTIPMMKESISGSSGKAGDNPNDPKAKSVLGGSLKRILKYSTMIFKPITLILGAGIKLLTGISKTIFKIGAKMMKSGAQDVFYGAKSLGQGLFGSKKQGQESVGLVGRAVGLPSRANQALSILTKGLVGEGKILKGIQNGIAKGFNKGIDFLISGAGKFKAVKEKITKTFNNITDKISNSFIGKAGKFFVGGFKKLVTDSKFLTGFFSARNEKKAAQAKAKADALMKSAPQTKSEAELSSINSEMNKSNGFLGGLLDAATNIKTLVEDIKAGNDPEAKAKLEADRKKEAAKRESEAEERRKAEEEKNKKQTRKERRAARKKNKEYQKYSKMSDEEKAEYRNKRNEEARKKKEKEKQKAAEQAAKDKKKAAKRAAADEKNTLGSRVRRAASAVKGKGSVRMDIGKTLGGISSMLGGIAKIVLGAITQLSGFKALMDMITNVLSSSLTPLNKAFQKIIKTLRPVMKTLKNAIKSIAKVVSDIAISLIDVLQPIFEDVLQPIIEALGPVLTEVATIIADTVVPILNVLVGTLLAPLLIEVVGVISPILTTISGAIEVIMGIIEGIFGAVMTVVGVLTLNKETTTNGVNMMKTGGALALQGLKDIGTGISGTIGAVASAFIADAEEEEVVEEKEPVKKNVDDSLPTGSILEGTYGNGDVINNTNSIINNYNSTGHIGDINNLSKMYGSANSQGSYGGYLGMDKHGCGPVALADAVSRRSGRNISATSLASSMAKSGTYSSSKGTSVAGYMSASSALGSNVVAGGVSSASLKRATPNNPVTLIGSGTGFGTKSGNNHYVNVIGSNGRGISYVSNPMTGGIEKRSTSDLINSSALGLYGSGDAGSSDSYYTFPDAVSDALAELKALAANLLKMFTGPTTEETIAGQIESGTQAKKNEQALADAKKTLGDDYQAYEDEARALAYADYEKKNPKLDSQSDADYEKKKEEYFQANLLKYLAQTKVFEDASSKAGDTWTNIYTASDNMYNSSDNIANGIDSTGSSYDTAGSEGYYGANKNVKMYNFGAFNHKETNITKAISDESPVHDFFTYMSGSKDGSVLATSESGQWYGYRSNPNSSGQGTTGDDHDGIDITLNRAIGGDTDQKPMYAITDGVVTHNEYQANGAGNYIRWKDNSDQYSHIYMHLTNKSSKKVGDKVKAGELLGYSGHSGGNYGPHIHYGIYDSPTGWSTINPLTYWRYKKGSASTSINGNEITGDTNMDKIWRALVVAKDSGGLGLTKAGAAAVLANMKQESGFDPTISGGEGWMDGEGSPGTRYAQLKNGQLSVSSYLTDLNQRGFGLCQWLGEGKEMLFDYADRNVDDVGTIKKQVDYLGYSMTEGKYANFYDKLVDALYGNDANKALDYFIRRYELGIGNDYEGNGFGSQSAASQYPDMSATRSQYLAEILDYYKNAAIPKTLSDDGTASYSLYDQQNSTIGSGHVDALGNVTINSQGDYEYYMNHKDDLYDSNGNLISSGSSSSSSDSSSSSSSSSSSNKNNSSNSKYKIGDYVRLRPNTRYGTNDIITQKQADHRYFIESASGGKYNVKSMISANPTVINGLSSDAFLTMSPHDFYNELYREDTLVPDELKTYASSKYKSSSDDKTNFNSLVIDTLKSTAVSKKENGKEYLPAELYTFNDAQYRSNSSNKGKGGYVPQSVRKSFWNDMNNAILKQKLKNTRGSGDVEPIMDDIDIRTYTGSGDASDFDIESYVGSGESTEIPPIDTDSAVWNAMGFNDTTDTSSGTSINYNVVRTSDPEADKRVKAIMSTTFEVKSKTIEAKLQEMIDLMNANASNGSWSSSYNGGSNTKLFNERVPSQVSKLAIG